MSNPLLLSKIYIPTLRQSIVSRPRLIERLNEGLYRKLTLISAPAGFGKTTLVSEWIAVAGTSVAWISLDEEDHDLTRFLTYFIAALQNISENLGEGILSSLQSRQPPSTDSILTNLLNEIAKIPNHFILVLDDYHLLDAKLVDEALSFVLDHLPQKMHLVITTREDPDIPLARLRARDQLIELRAADLRFTPAEASKFLNQVMTLQLTEQDIDTLETRTEGWITGLQLAALSMQDRKDNASFIQAFSGSHRFILDYLVEEVLHHQPEVVRSFLIQTAILDRMCGPLCEALLRIPVGSGQETLEFLEHANLFTIPLDNERFWYRYHHLFSELLRKQLGQNFLPEEIARLHIQASEWYEQNGFPQDSIHHAFAIDDFAHVAKLAELNWPAMNESVQSIKWYGWLKKLPDEIIRTRPVLCVNFAWALLNAGELEAADAKMKDVEYWLELTPATGKKSDNSSSEMVVVDEAQFKSLPMVLASARAYHAQAIGNISGTIEYAQRALDLSPNGVSPLPGVASSLLGLAQYANGNLDAAYQAFSVGLASMDRYASISGNFVLAGIKIAQGQLNTALSIYEKAISLVLEHGDPVPLGAEDLYTGISELHRERGDLDSAEHDLSIARMLGEKVDLPDWQHRWNIALARLYETQGDLSGALDLLEKAERLYIRTPVPNFRPIAALKTRIWVKRGRNTEALEWVHIRNLSFDDDIDYLHEFEYITLARVLIAHEKAGLENGCIQSAIGLLDRLLQAAETSGRMGSVIEILVLQALAHAAQGDVPLALEALERALTLAEPEGYFQIFIDEGNPMAALLQEVANHSIAPNYVHKLLAALRKPVTTASDIQPVNKAGSLLAKSIQVES